MLVRLLGKPPLPPPLRLISWCQVLIENKTGMWYMDRTLDCLEKVFKVTLSGLILHHGYNFYISDDITASVIMGSCSVVMLYRCFYKI